MSGPARTKPHDGLRAEIVSTRAELGETVEQLAARLDVKRQVEQRLDATRSAARDAVGKATHAVSAPARFAGRAVAPVANKARPHGKQIALAAAAVAIAGSVVVIWRRTAS